MGVLDDMTKGLTASGIAERKKVKAAGLTPTAAELKSVTPSIPNDVPGAFMAVESMQAQSQTLRRYAAELLAIANGLDVLAGEPVAVAEQAEKEASRDAALAEKEAERQADDRAKAADGDIAAQQRVEDLKERTARLAEEAQAAVFGNPVPQDAAVSHGVEQWVCAEHGAEDLVSLSTKAGDSYWACDVEDCTNFERLK